MNYKMESQETYACFTKWEKAKELRLEEFWNLISTEESRNSSRNQPKLRLNQDWLPLFSMFSPEKHSIRYPSSYGKFRKSS